ncbi:Eco57I restriction-modification methylase domain-containing protein [Vreelandella jeotgali]|uniref:Eco57I restriction-modification methylase domain-containing protein n=1 Tax=Vreelandella jeotgali TaxID=553386 RepID=UPI000345CEE1|nr:N-6 DNA methylase [Halomonas jeotgali]
MSLIAEQVLQNHVQPPTAIPDDHLATITAWKNSILSGDIERQNEVALHAPFTERILGTLLGYQSFGQGDSYTVAREYGIARGAVDIALGQFYGERERNQVKAVFEVKGAKTRDLDAIMPGRHKSPVQQAWEYARDVKGVDWVLVTNYREIRLYHVGETSLVYDTFDLTTLDDPWEYARFQLCLGAENLLNDRPLELLRQTQQADKDITARLYQDYKHLRETLIVTLMEANPEWAPARLVPAAQKLLDRILFLAFAEDTGLIPDNSIAQAYEHADPYNPRPVYDNFKGLFRAVDKGNKPLNIPAYNGGLFAEDAELDSLSVSDELCEAFKELAEYDFASEVSVTVLGRIFEQSITDLEALAEQLERGEAIVPQESARSVSGRRKLQGVVYTPDNITAFMVEQTLGCYLQRQFSRLLGDYGQLKNDGSIQWKRGKQNELKFWYAWQEALQHIRVVDPACGSGAFLLAAFDFLHAEYQRINDKLAELTGQPGVLDLNKEILNHNLYGVDINAESIEITKLSLWLKTAERGKPLTSLNACLRDGNSLGITRSVAGSAFCWHAAFPEIFADGGFDVVLGNPPYVRQERFSEMKPWLEAHYRVYHGVADLYAYFFELGLNLLKPGGMLGYISSSTFFKTNAGMPLRRHLAECTRLHSVVDFGDLQVFEGVTTYPAILVMENAAPTEDHRLAMLNLTDDLPENLGQRFSQDHGTMPQSRLGSEGWQLEDETLAALRHKLTHAADGTPYPSLKAVYGSPLYGIKTGCNKAFVIDQATRDALVAEDPASAEVLKPFLEGKDLKRWHAQNQGLWLIFARRGIDLDAYPAVKRHLEQYREQLEPKPRDWPRGKKWPGRKAGSYRWYEIQDTVAYYEKFALPKVFYPDITNSPKFYLDTGGAFAANTAYFYPDGNYYLVGLLNSQAVWFFLTGIADSVRGGFYRMFSQNVNRIPLPPASDEQQATIAELAEQCQQTAEQRQQVIERFARRLCDDLCPDGREPRLNTKSRQWWQLDFKTLQAEVKKSFKLKARDTLIAVAERDDWEDYFTDRQARVSTLDETLAATENRLNQAVNALFDLTREEQHLL